MKHREVIKDIAKSLLAWPVVVFVCWITDKLARRHWETDE